MLSCNYCAHLNRCIKDAYDNGYEHNSDFEGEEFCPHYGFKRNTNADRIRAMSDEELAAYLFSIGWDCHLCEEHERLENNPLLRGEKCDEHCTTHCLDWLQQPVKED